VVALPPDITPQIARLVATRFGEEKGVIRLAYEGTVVRLDQRARSQREIIQAGVEMAGVAGPAGDAEIVALAAAALEAVGFGRITIDIGHLGLCREVLDALGLPEAEREVVRGAIAKRDRVGLSRLLAKARGPAEVVRFASLLPTLSGPPEVLATALVRVPARPPGIRRALSDLRELLRELERYQLPADLHIDLSEVRGFDYYTGMRVQGYVPGAPDAILQGGRYDSLLGRYGHPSPAVGFAIDVEATAHALEVTDGSAPARPKGGADDGGVLLCGALDHALPAAETLRRAGRRAAVEIGGLAENELGAYAQRWGFAEVRTVGAGSASAPSGPRARRSRNKRGK